MRKNIAEIKDGKSTEQAQHWQTTTMLRQPAWNFRLQSKHTVAVVQKLNSDVAEYFE